MDSAGWRHTVVRGAAHCPLHGRRVRFALALTLTGVCAQRTLQRVHGVAFWSPAQLAAWQRAQHEAAARDHRRIGQQQSLFHFDGSVSPGCAFWLPHGTRIYNRLVDFMRRVTLSMGYDEVRTPIVYQQSLWQRSGHWSHYRDSMYAVSAASQAPVSSSDADAPMGLKPMNCPAHCVVYARETRSYRDLPLRLADFGPLHRNEAHGALGGLTRLRLFHQDDAHLFCTPEQVGDEVAACLGLVDRVYRALGFRKCAFRLSTRPATYMGSSEAWDTAESLLRAALARSGQPWSVSAGDGAFYGPKIDITVTDAVQREHQTATIQLDFQLPARFDLRYVGADGKLHQPVLIHRAILGSVERLLGVLMEHVAGAWPLWLNPRQLRICSVSRDACEAAGTAARRIADVGEAGQWPPPGLFDWPLYVDTDTSDVTLGRKIRNARLLHCAYIGVVGVEDARRGTVALRTGAGQQLGEHTPDGIAALLRSEMASELRGTR